MVCPECGLEIVERVVACPRCDTPFARRVGGLGWLVTVLFAVMAAALAAVVVLRLRHAAGGLLTLAGVGSGALFVALAAAFLVWFARVRRNAGLWAPQRYKQGWAVGGWFVPVAFAWIPVRIAADAWRAATDKESLPWPLYVWWICWAGSWLAGFHTTSVVSNSGGVAVAGVGVGFYWFNVPDLIVAAVAAVFGGVVVRMLSRAQDARTALGPVSATQFG